MLAHVNYKFYLRCFQGFEHQQHQCNRRWIVPGLKETQNTVSTEFINEHVLF